MVKLDFDKIEARLRHVPAATPTDDRKTRAAVAMIISHEKRVPELLFIRRATHELDPWSGHIAFPGGKLERGEEVCETARRETLEEIGIDLLAARYLGRLSDIIGANLPVRVSCCVYGIERCRLSPVLSDEVDELFWTPLDDLCDRSRHRQSPVAFGERTLEVPSILLPYPVTPVLWGITYRLVMQFLEAVADVPPVAISPGTCKLPGTINLSEEEKI